jgi:hypothetical protein
MSHDPIQTTEAYVQEVIKDEELSSAGNFSTITFTGGAYEFIEIVMHAKSTDTAAQGVTIDIRFNSDTTTANYWWQLHYAGEGSAQHTGADGASNLWGRCCTDHASNNANTFDICRSIIGGISDSNSYVHWNTESTQNRTSDGTQAYIERWGGGWESTANVTSIAFGMFAGQFHAGSHVIITGYKKVQAATLG